MRCLNCHTVMMATDTECPVCHAGVQLRACEMPQPNDKEGGSEGMRIFAGVAGGLVGAMLYDAVTGTGTAAPCVRPSSTGSHAYAGGGGGGGGGVRRVAGVVLVIVGGVLIAGAVRGMLNPDELSDDKSRPITAAELQQLDGPGAAPGGLVAYTVQKAKDTGIERVRQRTARSAEAKAHIFLLQVDNKWMIAAVPPGFKGNKLVGRLESLNTPQSRAMVEDILDNEPEPVALLPFELNTVDSIERNRPAHLFAVGLLAFLGLVGCGQGLRMVVGGGSRHTAPTVAAQSTGLSVQLPR
jgi:hypothetical protein